jgi:hypothetical protein
MKKNSKMVVRMFLLVGLVLLAGVGFGRKVEAKGADSNYKTATLVSYGIPENVVQVICDNSTMISGDMPTATALTIGDFENMSTVSLAKRTKNANGTYTSKTDPTVATWIAELLSATSDVTSMNNNVILNWQTVANTAFTPEVFFSNGISGTAELPKYNVLIEALNLAKNCETMDLTGILSKLPVSGQANYRQGLHISLLTIFYTESLSKLINLNLSFNNFGTDGNSSEFMSDFYQKRTLISSTVENWNFSNNMISTLDDNVFTKLGSQSKSIDFTGNTITSIAYSNIGSMGEVIRNPDGTIDLTGNPDIEVNQGVVQVIYGVLITASEGNSGFNLDSNIADDFIIYTLTKYWDKPTSKIVEGVSGSLSEVGLTDVINYNPALVSTTATDILIKKNVEALAKLQEDVLIKLINEHPDKEEEIRNAIKNYHESTSGSSSSSSTSGSSESSTSSTESSSTTTTTTTSTNSVGDGGSLGFGSISLADLYQKIIGTTENPVIVKEQDLNLSGTLLKGYTLKVKANPWVNEANQTQSFFPTMNLSLEVDTGADAQLDSASMVKVSTVSTQLTKSIPTATIINDPGENRAFQVKPAVDNPIALTNILGSGSITAGSYTSSLTWSIDAVPTESQQ